MQSTPPAPGEGPMSMLAYCRLLCPHETAAFDTAKGAMHIPDYDEAGYEDHKPLSPTEEKRQKDIAEACLQTIVDAITEAACASACAIWRKDILLPPSFFARRAGRTMLKNEILAQLEGRSRSSGRRASSLFVVQRRPERIALSDVIGKPGIAAVPAPAIDLTAQENAGDEGRLENAAAKGGSLNNAAPASRTRLHKQGPFLSWYERQPQETRLLGPQDLALAYKKEKGITISTRSVRRARKSVPDT